MTDPADNPNLTQLAAALDVIPPGSFRGVPSWLVQLIKAAYAAVGREVPAAVAVKQHDTTDKPSISELQQQRAQHTCIVLASPSVDCKACHDGAPNPALTIDEINEALRKGREEAEAAWPVLCSRPGHYR